MKYVIYMDVFFVVNLMMDFILLRMAAHYIKPQTTYKRCLLGGVVGSLVTCLSLLISYENMVVHMLISYIFTVVAMIIVAYGRCSLKQMVKRGICIYMVTIFMGGAMNLIYDYTYFGYMMHGIFSAVYANPINLLRMCLFTGISYVGLRVLSSFILKYRISNALVTVRLTLKDKSVVVRGLIDSGNSLKEPYLGKPVHIVEYDALHMILEGVDIHREKYRLVPFHSLGKRNGLVEVIDIDEIVVYASTEVLVDEDDNVKDEPLYIEKHPAIGLYHAVLSEDGRYQMLLNGVAGNSIQA